MSLLTRILQKLSLIQLPGAAAQLQSVRYRKYVDKPAPGKGISYRRLVNFPNKYTVEPLSVRNLGGRDPKTGRKVCEGIGGGIKHKYHWIEWKREAPADGTMQFEKVLRIFADGNRTAHVALVGVAGRLKYILATENMKEGDVIKTSMAIPRIPVKADEGDAYPLGALPTGTKVNCVEKEPGAGGALIHSAGNFGTILRKTANQQIILQLPSKRELLLSEQCMATVGRLSNPLHGETPIGSAQRSRELGNRPRSGWWHRKTGKHGRKVYKIPPPHAPRVKDAEGAQPLQLTLKKEIKF